MLFQLLKSALRWVYNLLFNNKIADAEARLYSNWFKEDVDDEGI